MPAHGRIAAATTRRRPRGAARRCAPDRSAARAPGRRAADRPSTSATAGRPVRPGRARRPAPSRSARGRSRGASRTAPRTGPGSPTRGSAADAWGRNEKMPPPSLLTRTIVADSPWSFAATSALRSWRNDTSPTTSATGPRATAAEPSAVETTPSIPFAPRFERTVIARSVDGSQPSRSRTGIELPAHSADAVRQGGRERRERRALERLVERGQPAVHRLDRRRGRRRSQSRGPGPSRRPGREALAARARAVCGRIGVDEGRRDQRGLAPAPIPRRGRSARASSAPAAPRSAWRWAWRRSGSRAPGDGPRSRRPAERAGPPRATTWRPVVATRPEAGQRVREDREPGRARRAPRARRGGPGRRPGPRR